MTEVILIPIDGRLEIVNVVHMEHGVRVKADAYPVYAFGETYEKAIEKIVRYTEDYLGVYDDRSD